jgi:hypothetical protein
MRSSNGYDCAREVSRRDSRVARRRDENLGPALRLAVRGYGSPDADGGASFDQSQLLFRNPGAIETIRLRFMVNSFSSAPCPTNSDAAHPQLLVSGTFFNSGGGDPIDDVKAYLMVERRTDDVSPPPTSLRVGGFMSARGGFFNNVDLGTVELGEEATATLKWDPPNHAFVVRVVKTVTRPAVVVATMP